MGLGHFCVTLTHVCVIFFLRVCCDRGKLQVSSSIRVFRLEFTVRKMWRCRHFYILYTGNLYIFVLFIDYFDLKSMFLQLNFQSSEAGNRNSVGNYPIYCAHLAPEEELC